MFFGKYLLENGVVTPEQLVEAITIQMESLPSIIRMVRKKNMLDCKEIVELVEKSIDERKNITDMMVEKSLLARDEMEGLMEARCKAGMGLCEILVREGHASSMIVNEYVKKYLKYHGDSSKTDSEGFLDFNIRGEFVKIFDRELCQAINGEVENIRNKEREQHIFNIKKDFSLLATVAEIGGLEHIMNLFQAWLEVLEQTEGVSNKGHWAEVASGLRLMMEFVWNLREEFARGEEEAHLLKEEKWKKEYNDGMRRAEYLLRDYQSKKMA